MRPTRFKLLEKYVEKYDMELARKNMVPAKQKKIR